MPEPWTTERPKVLVIADDQDTGEVLARLLDRAGWTTDLAFSASSGLSELEDAHYVALVVDLATTDDALELLRTVRGDERSAALRVVVCAPSAAGRGEAWITGADAYLAHPFEGDAFVAEVDAVISRPDDERDAHRQHQVGLSIPDAPD